MEMEKFLKTWLDFYKALTPVYMRSHSLKCMSRERQAKKYFVDLCL